MLSTLEANPAQRRRAASGPSATAALAPQRSRLVLAVQKRVFAGQAEYQRFARSSSEDGAAGLVDYLFAASGDPCTPAAVFERLRWGGVFVYVCAEADEAARVAAGFTFRNGFEVGAGPAYVRDGPWWLRLPWWSPKKIYYFTARKVRLVGPGQRTDRFTYDVRLVHDPAGGEDQHVVLKQIPSYKNMVRRLSDRFPKMDQGALAQRARELVDQVLPVFLTREAAFLEILQRELPGDYRHRVPRVLRTEKDSRGFVRKLHMRWLRNGGRPMTQFQFARQAMELLAVLHEKAQIMHLDLRLDNLVVTEQGVGFVDFGSAVRLDEDLSESKTLAKLFDQILWTSSIQRTLGRMKESGQVTSKVLSNGHHRLDKAVDVFYLALQMNRPHDNPEFRDLVRYEPNGSEARGLAGLTEEVLRPADCDDPRYKSAGDILRGMERIERGK